MGRIVQTNLISFLSASLVADEANHVIKVVTSTISKAVLNTSTLKYSDLVLFDLISFYWEEQN